MEIILLIFLLVMGLCLTISCAFLVMVFIYNMGTKPPTKEEWKILK